MDMYSIVILFLNDKACINVLNNNAGMFLLEDPINYKTSVIVNSNRTELIAVEGNNHAYQFYTKKLNQQKYMYINNLLAYFMENYSKNDPTGQHVLGIFSHYLRQIISSFKKKITDSIPNLNSEICSFTFVTPRIWGYHVSVDHLYSLFITAGLVSVDNYAEKVMIYYDLDLHIDAIQDEGIKIRDIRKCMFCTFFVTIDSKKVPTLINTTDTFQSGLSYSLWNRFSEEPITPINKESLPLKENVAGISKILKELKCFIKSRLQEPRNCPSQKLDHAMNTNIIERRIVTQIKNQSTAVTSSMRKYVLPIKIILQQKNTLTSYIDTLLRYLVNATVKASYSKNSLEEFLPFENYVARGNEAMTNGLTTITMQDIYNIFEPYMKDPLLDIQTTMKRYPVRHIFFQLFYRPDCVDNGIMCTAWLFIYFLNYALDSRKQEYVEHCFVNSSVYPAFYSVIKNYDGPLRYIMDRKVAKNYSVRRYLPTSTFKENQREPSKLEFREADITVHFDLSIEGTSLFISKNKDKSEYVQRSKNLGFVVEPFNHLLDIDLETDNARVFTDARTDYSEELKYIKERFERKLSRENFANEWAYPNVTNVDSIRDLFRKVSKKIHSYNDILYEMVEIQLQSKATKAHRTMYQNHFLEILLALYIIYLKDSIDTSMDLVNKQAEYTITIDSLIETMLPMESNTTMLEGFITALSRDKEPLENLYLLGKRCICIATIQNNSIYEKIPIGSLFRAIQITKRYCHMSLDLIVNQPGPANKPCSMKMSSLYEHLDFYKLATDYLWLFLQEANSNCNFFNATFTLENYRMFKQELREYFLNIYCKLTVKDDMDAEYELRVYKQMMGQYNDSISVTHRMVWEIAVIPAIKRIVSLIKSQLWDETIFSYMSDRSSHIFIVLDDFTNFKADIKSNLSQQLLKRELANQLTEFCINTETHLTKYNFSIIDIDTKETQNLYLLAPGPRDFVFNTTYAVEFSLTNGKKDKLELFEGNSTKENRKKLDKTSLFVFAKQGQYTHPETRCRSFRINPSSLDHGLSLDFFQIHDVVKSDSIPISSLSKLQYTKMARIYVNKEIFMDEDFAIFPVVKLYVKYQSRFQTSRITVRSPLENQNYVSFPFEPLFVV